ncbi:MAG: N-acetylmuramoyl-L-alanine amidase [Clostridia bacterium]|nr:N-acetylmuramoyl-L-alanine amidase [Clostridia bacterium]
MFRIILDAGHGLYTPGKRCLKSLDPAETREWILNSRICDKVESLLDAYDGYSLTRADDRTGERDIPLQERTDMANKSKADFYLSVHHNAGIGGGSGGGPVTIAYTNASAKSLECQKIVHTCFTNAVGTFGNRANGMPLQNLHVLRETNMPAVLIECGFMDSAVDVPLILSEEFAEKAAKGLVQALVQIGKLKKKEDAKVEEKFVDIKGHYAEKAIKDLYAFGVINGVDETHFAPDEPVTRGQVAVIARNIIRYITGE